MDYVLPLTPHLEARALDIKRTLGLRAAAGYLRNRGVAICYAVDLLARRRT